MISRLYNDWLKSTVSYNNFTLLVLSNICSILNRKNNILSYYSKALMHLCKLILIPYYIL